MALVLYYMELQVGGVYTQIHAKKKSMTKYFRRGCVNCLIDPTTWFSLVLGNKCK